MVRDANGSVAGRCSVWWRGTPTLGGAPVGVIGHYAATSDAAGRAVLGAACGRIRTGGPRVVVGPMDGSTWRRYRFVTEPGTEPPFFLEPVNLPSWPAQWVSAGFEPLATYISSLAPRPQAADPRIAKAERRAKAAGITLRGFRVDDFEGELAKVYRLSLRSFADNFLYTPISKEEFAAQYGAVHPFLDPRLVLLAEQESGVVGFSFAVPDVLQKQRGSKVDAAILKTLAVDPALSGQGLGGLLTARTLDAVWQNGYRRAIGALMHVDNRSRRISEHYANVIRGYTLYRRALPG